MRVEIYESKSEMASSAAERAAVIIREAIAERGEACLIAATGASQFEFLDVLTAKHDIEWQRVIFFHLDEYVGLPRTHPASFRKYLRERIVERVGPGAFHFIEGDSPDPSAECLRLAGLISARTIDVAFVGIGENGHLAFNDPPADFETEEPYIVVELDEECRRQQVGEGWFASVEEVPSHAISMSIREILRARNVICVVPDRRKAEAVRDCLELEVSPMRPSSALRRHGSATVYLDAESASLLRGGAARGVLEFGE